MVFALYNHGRLPLHYKSKQKGVYGEMKGMVKIKIANL